MSLEYNSQRPGILLKEYGRNIQKLVEYVRTIEDAEKRTRYASTLTDLMKQIHPSLKDNPEYDQKVWDDLYIISDYDLEVESPFPMPEKSLLGKKPQRLNYNQGKIRFRHYGGNIEVMIQRAIEMEDPEDKESAIIHIGRLMKRFYATWNNENIDDDVVIKNIHNLSNGQLQVDAEKVKEHGLFNTTVKERKPNRDHGGNQGGRRRNFQKRRRN